VILKLGPLAAAQPRPEERVRRGEFEAGVVLLPFDDDKHCVRSIVRDEVLYPNPRDLSVNSRTRS
jgi:hypothetical protein